jgi:hypothetical protein
MSERSLWPRCLGRSRLLSSCANVPKSAENRRTSGKKGYERGGVEALVDRSRAPHSHPHAVVAEVALLLVNGRRKHPAWGLQKLLVAPAQEAAPPPVPAVTNNPLQPDLEHAFADSVSVSGQEREAGARGAAESAWRARTARNTEPASRDPLPAARCTVAPALARPSGTDLRHGSFCK